MAKGDKKRLVKGCKRRLTNLASREKSILRKQMGKGSEKGKPLNKIGKDFKVTRERIKEIEKRALKRLNQNQPEPPDEAA